jgi:hypothetical protein
MIRDASARTLGSVTRRTRDGRPRSRPSTTMRSIMPDNPGKCRCAFLFHTGQESIGAVNEDFIDVPGGKVWHKIAGDGDGDGDGDETPPLCLHGGPGSAHYCLEPLKAPGRRRGVIMHHRIPDSQLAVIENASHLCFAGQPVDFTVRADDFLDRTDEAASRQLAAR